MRQGQKMGQVDNDQTKHVHTSMSAVMYKRLRLIASLNDADLKSIVIVACQEYLDKHWKEIISKI